MLYLRPVHDPAFFREQAAKITSVGAGAGPAVVDVGAGGVSTAAGGIVYLVAAGVEGAFSYALYTGKYIFTNKHPIWGTIFAILTIGSLWSAGDKLTRSEA